MDLIAMELQNVPPAPGRGESAQPTQPATGAPPGHDQPQGGASGGGFGGIGMMLLMFLPMLAVIFLLNRSQSKKQKEIESKLKKGDRVLTASGMVGKLVEISPDSKYVKLEINSGVKVEMLKTAIQGLDTGDVAAVAGKSEKGSSGKDAAPDKK